MHARNGEVHLVSLGISGDRTPIYFDQQPWARQALCAQTDPEVFYPDKGGSTRQAKGVCARCEVTEQCLEYALDREERFGIFGGKSERERRKIIADRKLVSA